MTSPYEKAQELGYTDEQIIEHFTKKDPDFAKKYEKGKELGFSSADIFNKASDSYKKVKEPEAQKKPDWGDYAKESVEDFGKQGAQGLGIGAIGTYGDILDLLGLQAKETLPNEKAKYGREFQILEKMERGEVPSYGELMELSSDEELAPRFSRLPSSEDLEKIGTELGVVSEPKTPAGRYGRRIGKLTGSGASLGGGGLLSPILAGAAGQTLEEAGLPPWAQAAAEIIVSLKYAPKSSVPVTSKTKQVEETIKDLRKAGYSEQDITLAKNALEERKILKKYSSLTPEAENKINQGVKNSEKLLNEQIKKGLPGYAEGGLPFLEKQASNVYQTMEEVAQSVAINNPKPVQKAIQNAIDYLEKYPLLKEQKEMIEFLKDGLAKSSNANTAEFFTGFYRNLGKAGNWGNPKQKEHLLGMVKEGIKETFEQSGKEAKKFGEYFEKTNEAWKKWLNAKDLMTTLEKSLTVEGTNFKKVSHMLNDPETLKLANKVLGPEQVRNINVIAEGAQSIESLLKQIPKSDKSIQSLKILEGIRSMFNGDFKVLGSLIGMEGAKRLATDMLINPEKQNIMKKIITSAKNNSPQQAAILAEELVAEESKKHSSQAKATRLRQE
jgi:hypothetical protein